MVGQICPSGPTTGINCKTGGTENWCTNYNKFIAFVCVYVCVRACVHACVRVCVCVSLSPDRLTLAYPV